MKEENKNALTNFFEIDFFNNLFKEKSPQEKWLYLQNQDIPLNAIKSSVTWAEKNESKIITKELHTITFESTDKKVIDNIGNIIDCLPKVDLEKDTLNKKVNKYLEVLKKYDNK